MPWLAGIQGRGARKPIFANLVLCRSAGVTAQGPQHLLACPPIGRQAQFALRLLQRIPGMGADEAIGLANVIAAGNQQSLQFAPLGATARIIGRPGLDQRAAAASRSDRCAIASA